MDEAQHQAETGGISCPAPAVMRRNAGLRPESAAFAQGADLMSAAETPRRLGYRRCAMAGGLAAATIGILALAGWWFDIPTLRRVFPGLVEMTANTALCLVLAGASLWLQRDDKPSTSQLRDAFICAGLVMIVAVLTLIEYQGGWNLGIDELLVRDFTPRVDTSIPGRMAPASAILFLLISAALLLLNSRIGATASQLLALLVFGGSLLPILGYLFRVNNLYKMGSGTAVALHTGIGFALLGAGTLLVRPDRGLMVAVTSNNSGGVLARRLLPAAFIIPILIGWCRLMGEDAGLFGARAGVAIVTLANMATIAGLVLWTAVSLHRSEEIRLQSENKFRMVVESAPNGLVMSDCLGRIVLVNERAERQFGYSRQDLLGRSIEILVPDRVRDRHVQLREEFFANPSARPMGIGRELFGRHRDGTEFPVEIGLTPIVGSDGLHVLSAVVDISERKQGEERFRIAVESAPNGMVMVDQDGQIVLVNTETERLFGYSRRELLGQSIEILVPQRVRARHPAYRTDFFANPSVRAMGMGRDLFAQRKDGSEFPVEIGLTPIRTERGLVVLSAIVDISERKRSEGEARRFSQELEKRVHERTTQLEAANKELEAFSYSVSHDLRAPLRAIDGFSRIVLEDFAPALPEEAKQYLRDVRSNTQRMGQLVDDLLAFARLGRVSLHKELLEPDPIVRQCVDELQCQVNGRQVDVRVGPLAPCDADPSLLKQVWMNLISNAFKYTGKRDVAVIEIASREGDASGTAVYFIKDNGAGFDMCYVDKLFGVFQRLHRAEEYEGTGVGLAIVHRIVTRHGGRVWAEAEPDKGATFFFTLEGESPHGGSGR